MTRAQLEHAIRAACDVAQDNELWVFGSQAILGAFPDAPEALRASIELDVQPKNRPENTDAVDGALGELSLFHKTHGFYVHGINIRSAKLPSGWKKRVQGVCDESAVEGYTGWCIEPHDLAASKLAAGRKKDLDFVRILLREKMIKPAVLKTRISILPIAKNIRENLLRWTISTAHDRL